MKASDGSLLGDPGRTPLSKKEGVKWQRPRLTRQALMRCCLVKWILSSAAPQGSERSKAPGAAQGPALRLRECQHGCKQHLGHIVTFFFRFISGNLARDAGPLARPVTASGRARGLGSRVSLSGCSVLKDKRLEQLRGGRKVRPRPPGSPAALKNGRGGRCPQQPRAKCGHVDPRDSSDSELELSAVRHQPERLDQLQAQTKFTKKELQSLYRGFKNDFPSLGLSGASGASAADATTYAHFLFNAFDADGNGAIHFEDFVVGLSILLRGTVHEKLKWAFNLYDINKDGYITKETYIPGCGGPGICVLLATCLCPIQPVSLLILPHGEVLGETPVEKLRAGVVELVLAPTNYGQAHASPSGPLQEMLAIIKSIYDMMGRHTYPILREDAPLEHVERFFRETHLAGGQDPEKPFTTIPTAQSVNHISEQTCGHLCLSRSTCQAARQGGAGVQRAGMRSGGREPRKAAGKWLQKMDRNQDGVVTIDEFLETCQKDKDIMSSMQLFENVI
ncbi:hypothetical protein CB1_000321037 [Camelus ferus]|nr:hypothetical protein CB1_000321037 [Camelus ferus]